MRLATQMHCYQAIGNYLGITISYYEGGIPTETLVHVLREKYHVAMIEEGWIDPLYVRVLKPSYIVVIIEGHVYLQDTIGITLIDTAPILRQLYPTLGYILVTNKNIQL